MSKAQAGNASNDLAQAGNLPPAHQGITGRSSLPGWGLACLTLLRGPAALTGQEDKHQVGCPGRCSGGLRPAWRVLEQGQQTSPGADSQHLGCVRQSPWLIPLLFL